MLCCRQLLLFFLTNFHVCVCLYVRFVPFLTTGEISSVDIFVFILTTHLSNVPSPSIRKITIIEFIVLARFVLCSIISFFVCVIIIDF
jgi:hypothetical protein